MTATLQNTSLTGILNSIQQIYQLKAQHRSGWLQSGIAAGEVESVAAHSFGVALLVPLIQSLVNRPELDWSRIQQMALLHDIGEAIVGDITPRDGIGREEKYRQEREAVHQLTRAFPNAGDLQEIWQEFETGESSEAGLVRQLDHLDRLIQADLYEQAGHDLKDFFTEMDQHFSDSPLEPIFRTLMQLRAEREQ